MSRVSGRVSMWISEESRASFGLNGQVDRIFRSVVLCTAGWEKRREIVSEEVKPGELRKQAQVYRNRERDEGNSGDERKQKSRTEGGRKVKGAA